MWNSPIPEERWTGFRRLHPGVEAFVDRGRFEAAAADELRRSLNDHDRETLGRLLTRGKKLELEVFVRTHGANPIFDPQGDFDVPVGISRADVVPLDREATEEAHRAVLDGRVVHVLFQAGEASRFQEGPLYRLSPVAVTRRLLQANGNGTDLSPEVRDELATWLSRAENAGAPLSEEARRFLTEGELGPKQPMLLRAAVRRVVQYEVNAGRLSPSDAPDAYLSALGQQKLLFFVSRRGGLSAFHDETLRSRYRFFGFAPQNVVTIEQELAHGLTVDERGEVRLLDGEEQEDAAGHLYALIQSARTGDFTTYTESGRPIKPMEQDALSYFGSRGGRVLSIIRINDMDRHSTEILNARALSHALRLFADGYVNAIETVANPEGQKGGTGTTFGDPNLHVLTETHENSFPSLSRAVDAAMKSYLAESGGRHPAYNAMRQWADLRVTREALRTFGGRIVFVPRQKTIDGRETTYVGVDMPMGDLSLLYANYRSRMFQFAGPDGRELLIHDMKKKENLTAALRAIVRQLSDPFVRAAAEEAVGHAVPPFAGHLADDTPYGAPAPEFDR